MLADQGHAEDGTKLIGMCGIHPLHLYSFPDVTAFERDKMYKWFLSLKQSDGSFLVSHDAEVDVRGLYCLLVTATLLDLLTPELLAGVPEFIAACQSYEGGFSSSSLPYFDGTDASKLTTSCLGEAHGGYTFSCLASWVLVQPYLVALRESGEFTKASVSINFKSLLRWMVNMQGGELDLGGFRGRTNKLVDGCYSWWVGGCFPLLESLGVAVKPSTDVAQASSTEEEGWHDADGLYLVAGHATYGPDLSIDSLYSRQGLQEYLLWAGQHPSGGLRDKPPKRAFFLKRYLLTADRLRVGIPMHTIHVIVYLDYRLPNTAWLYRREGGVPSLRCGKVEVAVLVRQVVDLWFPPLTKKGRWIYRFAS